MVYDDRGRTILTVQPNGLCVCPGYDNAGQLVRRLTIRPETVPASEPLDPDAIADAYITADDFPAFIVALDAYLEGLDITSHEIIGSLESFTYDANGNRLTQTDPVEIRWNNTTGVADPNILMRFAASEHTTRISYDSANRLTSTNNALSTPSDPRVWTREYDAAGRLIARTDANGTRIGQTYNADGQLASIDYPNCKRVTYDWTCCRMASMCDDYGRSRFTYDVANRLVSAVDATGHVVLNRYDGAGRRSALTLPDGSAYAYDYDTMGNLDSIASTRSGQTSLFERDVARRLLNYTPVGDPIAYTWGATSLTSVSRGLEFTEGYTLADPQMPGQSPYKVDTTTFPLGTTADDKITVRRDLRVSGEEHTGASEDMEYTYGYDPAGNRAEKVNLLTSPDPTLLQNYFNGANQLMGTQALVTPVDPPVLATPPGNVLLDKNGNTTQLTQALSGGGSVTWNFRYDYENRLIEARFQTTPAPEVDFPLIETGILIFGYDGLGRRVYTQVNATGGSWFVYDGGYLVQEREFRSDDLIAEYGWGPTSGVPAIFYQHRVGAPDPDVWFYTSPQGGFPRYVIDAGGDIIDALQYSSYGELVFQDTAGTPTEIDFGWKGNWNALVAGESSLSLWQGTGIAFIPGMGWTVNGSMNRDESIGGHTPPGTQPQPDPFDPNHFNPDSSELLSGWYYCVVACSPPGPYRVCMVAFCILSTKANLHGGCKLNAGSLSSGGVVGSGGGLDPGFETSPVGVTGSSSQLFRWSGLSGAGLTLPSLGKMTCKGAENWEKCECGLTCGFDTCVTAGGWASVALAYAPTLVPSTNQCHDDECDAFRHCYWACLMQGDPMVGGIKLFGGTTCAENILQTHEIVGQYCGNPRNAALMDDFNNRVGVNCGRNLRSEPYTGCEDCCCNALHNGGLQVLKPSVPPKRCTSFRWP